MLVELSIRNFALISSLTISFNKGLNVLTGETGAGKSIIMDAISLLIGGRSSVEFIRHGEKKAEIEGLFEMKANHPVLSLVKELGIDSEDETLILRRDLSIQGKSICRVNGKLVTLAILREIGQALVDIHGQHEHQHLLLEEKHSSLLDDYGKAEIEEHKKEYQQLFQQFKKINQQIKQYTQGEQELVHRMDLLKFQLDEITSSHLELGEDEMLLAEKRKRSHAQRIVKGLEESYAALHGDGKALDSLSIIKHHMEDLADIDEGLQPTAELVEHIYYQIEEVSEHLRKYKSQVEFEPERLHEIETRLVEIEQLKRKYGRNIDSILEYAAKIEDELDTIENKEERIQELLNKRQAILMDMVVEAKNLSKIRKQVSKNLGEDIKQELKGLYMDKTEIEIQINPLETGEQIEDEGGFRYIRSDGWDHIQFLISPNPGEPLKPLSKIASGGELSRLVLALKTVFSQIDYVTTLIFDEVDTGVSGRVAQAMAEKLFAISNGQQVLCITHHSQVAALSDEHYHIVKEMTDDETVTKVIPLQKVQRVEELARMMSGTEVTKTTKKHAEELLQTAKSLKAEIKEKLSI
jgi:DNA repair protein RecN (Recombination protein N)